MPAHVSHAAGNRKLYSITRDAVLTAGWSSLKATQGQQKCAFREGWLAQEFEEHGGKLVVLIKEGGAKVLVLVIAVLLFRQAVVRCADPLELDFGFLFIVWVLVRVPAGCGEGMSLPTQALQCTCDNYSLQSAYAA